MSLTLHIVFGSRDADLVYWKSSIPKKCFNYYVNRIIECERNKEIAVLPLPEHPGVECRKLSIHLTFRSAPDIRYVRAFPKRKRGVYLKEIMRKHILENYRRMKTIEADLSDESTEAELKDNTTESSPAYILPADQTKEITEVEAADAEDEISEEYKNMLREMTGY